MKQTLLICVLLASAIRGQAVQLNITVDERMELLTTVQLLANYSLLTPSDIAYKNEVAEHFAAYKDMDAVKIVSVIKNEYFAFSAAPTYIYHYSLPGFEQTSPFTDEDKDILDYEQNKETLTRLVVALKDFYVQSHFHEFYLQHRIMYDSMIHSVQAAIGDKDVIATMEHHYGSSNPAYNIVLTPLLHDGGFAVKTVSEKGNTLYAIIGPQADSKATPVFNSKNLLQMYVLHEFSHPFCNPLIDKYYRLLEADTCLLNPILASQEQQGYGNWKECLYEHLVRANELVLTKTILGEAESGKIYKEYYDDRQWIYLKGLVPLIEQYTHNRDRYKSLDDFMYVIIDYFSKEAQKCH